MNWDALAAVAELLGAGGVIASLVYLAVQIKHARRATRQAAARSVIGSINAAMEALAGSRESAQIFVRGIEGQLNADDFVSTAQFSARMVALYRPYEELYYYHKAGDVEEWLWKSLDSALYDVQETVGFRKWWSVRSGWFSDEFRDFIAARMPSDSKHLSADWKQGEPN